jgi:hypothetical protein
MSAVKWVQIALPDAYFESLGLVFPGFDSARSAEPRSTDPYAAWCGRGEL